MQNPCHPAVSIPLLLEVKARRWRPWGLWRLNTAMPCTFCVGFIFVIFAYYFFKVQEKFNPGNYVHREEIQRYHLPAETQKYTVVTEVIAHFRRRFQCSLSIRRAIDKTNWTLIFGQEAAVSFLRDSSIKMFAGQFSTISKTCENKWHYGASRSFIHIFAYISVMS